MVGIFLKQKDPNLHPNILHFLMLGAPKQCC